MSTTIADLSAYGDVKGRDTYSRNSYHSVKGDGASVNTITDGYYGIPSTTDTEVELARLTVAEGVVDDEIATMTFSVNDGTTLNTTMTLNNTISEITSTTINLTADDVVASGTLNVGTIEKNVLAEGARVELVDDATDPAINFVLGDLAGTPSTPLIVTEDTVAVVGTLTVDGVDLVTTIEGAAQWEATGAVAQLKAAFTSVEVNVANTYTTSIALDVNGSQVIRGNDLYFFDDTTSTNYSALFFSETAEELRLRSSRAGDDLIFATTTGTDNTYLDRLTFDDGAGTQSATFTNVNVGIGAAPSGTFALEVTGGASLTAGLVTGDDIDVAGNNVINVSQIDSTTALAENARIQLTESATDATVEVVIGDLAGTPATIASFSDTIALINVPTTIEGNVIITGDIQIQGSQTTLDTEILTVEDVNIDLGSAATIHSDIEGGGITLGSTVTGITVPAIAYSVAGTRWESTVGLNVDTAGTVTVGTTTTLADGSLELASDTGYMYFGSTLQWRLGMYNDGADDHFSIDHLEGGVYVSKLDVME